MDLEGIMLSEIRQGKKNSAWYHWYVETKKQTKENKNKLTDSSNTWVLAARGGGGREG